MDELEKKVIEMRLSGDNYDTILSELIISRDKLKQICRDNNLNTATKKKISEELIIEIKDFYNLGNSLRVTSKEFKISRETIRKYVEIRKRRVLSNGERKKSNAKYVTNWRKRKKEELVEYKGGKCEKCGYDKCLTALEFHHLDPNEKDFGISASNYSIERLKSEVDKCILVCANCHAEIHNPC